MKFQINRIHYLGEWKGDECIDANPDINEMTFSEVYDFKNMDVAVKMIPKIFHNEKEISGCELPNEPQEKFKNFARFSIARPKKDHINMDCIEISAGVEKPSMNGNWLVFEAFDNYD